ncbi:putative endo-beta-N-acetylglucosaminidase precursor [Clostridium puniceum]|uniref:Putative endo-beta-N-acetylglucosaminidase n=1 Tax=Clostridium puniceum TaxID=29367 RepID=A0A1S8TS17_9CLOT|nr:hypothetical protein [Clostridium puniceum]OOM80580.1 putative endo-beta-N-acetylglucosaminidase precursor [Clostridium puniceum]
MKRKNVLFQKIYFVLISIMLFTTMIAGIQAMASTNSAATDSEEKKVRWESTTKDGDIKAPEGVTGDGGKWESSTYTPSDGNISSENIEKKSMSAAEEYGAIAAGLMGLLAISAAKSGAASMPEVSEGNGIWVPEADRDAVTKMINKAASKEYYIDANGFVKEVPGAAENLNKSSTYSSVLDRLINGDEKVVIGVNDGWVSYGKNGLEANAFTGDNSGITIGDNWTSQVVMVTGKDTVGSSADITLAHELTHALRGELGLKSINTGGGINHDEEASTIEVENRIRKELGYALRTDGDSVDGGDESYGNYNNASEEKGWYDNIDKLEGSKTLAGNAYSKLASYGAPGSNYGPAHPDAPHVTIDVPSKEAVEVINEIKKRKKKRRRPKSDSGSSEAGYNYDESDWDDVVESVEYTLDKWDDDNDYKWDWGTFWDSGNKISNKEAETVRSEVQSAVSKYIAEDLGTHDTYSLHEIFKSSSKGNAKWKQGNDGSWYYYVKGEKKTGWIQDKGKWYYLNSNGKMETGWVKDNKDWYYLDTDGKMVTDDWKQDQYGKWYYLDTNGKMATDKWKKGKDGYFYCLDSSGNMVKENWVQDKGKWYYLNPKGQMLTGWQEINNQEYFFDWSTGEMKTGLIKDGDGKLYNLDDDSGAVKTGWMKKDDDTWYYFGGDDGESITGWINDNGTSYYLDENGNIKTGWFQYGESWYYLDSDSGVMQTGWKQYGDSWYYFNPRGDMKKGWLEEKGNWYYLNSEGEMLTDTWIPDEENSEEWHYVGSDGIMQIDEEIDEIDDIYEIYEGGLIEVLPIKVTDGAAVTYDGFELPDGNNDNTIVARLSNGTSAYIFKSVNAFLKFEALNSMGENNGEAGVIYVTEEQEELADAGADILTGEFAGNFVPIIVNGIKAYKSLKTGEIIYSKSFSANSGVGDAFEGAGEAGWDMLKGGGYINGRRYSQHAMERMAPDTPQVRAELEKIAADLAKGKGLEPQTKAYSDFVKKYVDPRNIPPSAIEDAIKNTTSAPGKYADTFIHETGDVTVVVNGVGDVITVIPK